MSKYLQITCSDINKDKQANQKKEIGNTSELWNKLNRKIKKMRKCCGSVTLGIEELKTARCVYSKNQHACQCL